MSDDGRQARGDRDDERGEPAGTRRDVSRTADPAAGLTLPNEIAVLWRGAPPARRGPRPGLTLDDIADAALAIADADGLEAVSMARVADRLGYTAMSLYRYVSSKDEVVALMLDRTTGDPPATDPSAGWRERLEVLLRAQLAVVTAHRWAASTPALYTTLGPHLLAWTDAFVAALDGTGLTSTQKLAIVGSLANQVLADVRATAALTAVPGDAADDAPGVDTLFAALATPDAYPALAAAFADGRTGRPPGTPADALTPGLRLLLDGVATWIAATGTTPAEPPAGTA